MASDAPAKDQGEFVGLTHRAIGVEQPLLEGIDGGATTEDEVVAKLHLGKKQPVLNAGEEHQYTSGAVLMTPVGTMEGSYEMHEPDGRTFKAVIPRFQLQKPGVLQ